MKPLLISKNYAIIKINKQIGLCELSSKYFEYWGDDDVENDWEKLLNELGIRCAVLPIEYRDESESIDFLFEYCLGNKELVDKFRRKK